MASSALSFVGIPAMEVAYPTNEAILAKAREVAGHVPNMKNTQLVEDHNNDVGDDLATGRTGRYDSATLLHLFIFEVPGTPIK